MKKILKECNRAMLLFLAVSAIAALYPIYKIISYEFPLTQPTIYKFEIEALDPYDSFRGRYIVLSPRPSIIIAENGEDFSGGRYVYAIVTRDKEGFAKIASLSMRQPDVPSLKIRSPYLEREYPGLKKGESAYRVELPFTKYFMNEKIAPKAEELTTKMLRRGVKTAAVVKIYRDGNYSVTDIEIGGRSIREYLK